MSMARAYLQEVRCRSCHRTVALALRNFAVYCDKICAQEPPAGTSEDRDALIEILDQEGATFRELAGLFGVSRQAIHQILNRISSAT